MSGHYAEKNIIELVKQSGKLPNDFKTMRRDQIDHEKCERLTLDEK
jgi:hypothetical protein